MPTFITPPPHERFPLLWQNSNPQSTFWGNITLPTDKYRFILLQIYNGATHILQQGSSQQISKFYFNQGSGLFMNRSCTYNGNIVKLDSCYYGRVSSGSINDAYLIPYQIYGIEE